MTDDAAPKLKTIPEGPEDGFVYAAVEVFSIISPYVFHTHAPRVFSEISATLKRAQEASAEVIAQLNASEKAQARERELRSLEVNRHLSQLKELQALLKARADKEAEINGRRTSLERKLTEEQSRSAGLERRLAESGDRVRLLQEEFILAKIALDEQRDRTLAEAVAAAKEAGREEVAAKVEASMLKRVRMLSSENSSLKAKLRASKAPSSNLQENVLSRFPSSDSERTSSLSPGASSRASVSFPSRESSPGGLKNFDSPLPPLLRRVTKKATSYDGSTKTATAVGPVGLDIQICPDVEMGSEIEVGPEIEVGSEIEVGPELEMGPEIEAGPEFEAGREHAESKSGFAEAVMGLTERGSGIAGKVLGFAERGLGIFPRGSAEPGDEARDFGFGSGSKTSAGKQAVAPGGIGRGSSPSDDLRVRQLRRVATWATADATSRRSANEQDQRRPNSTSKSSKNGTLCQDEHGVRKRGLGAFPHIAKGPRSYSSPCGGSVDGDSSTAAVPGGGAPSACSGLLGNEPDHRRPHSFSASSSPLSSFYSGRGSSGGGRSSGGRAARRWQRSLGAGSNSPSLEALLASGKFYSEGSGQGRGRGAGASAPLPLDPRRRLPEGEVERGAAGVGGLDGNASAGVGAGEGVEQFGPLFDAPGVPCATAANVTDAAAAAADAAAAAGSVGGEGCDGFSAESSTAAAAAAATAADTAAAAGDNDLVSGEEGTTSTDVTCEFTGNGATEGPHAASEGGSGASTASGGGNKPPRTAPARPRPATSTSDVVDVPDADKSLDDLLREMAVMEVGEEGFSADEESGIGGGDDDSWLAEEGGGGEGLEGGVDKRTPDGGLGMEVAPLKIRGRTLCV